jgi:hypothetical protein
MKLIELDPWFIRRETRACRGGPGCSVVSPHTEHDYLVKVDSLREADGILFLCPKCIAENRGPAGTHSVICWRPRVPANVDPKPGRWEFTGTRLDDLSLVAGSSSVLLTDGCAAHFFFGERCDSDGVMSDRVRECVD